MPSDFASWRALGLWEGWEGSETCHAWAWTATEKRSSGVWDERRSVSCQEWALYIYSESHLVGCQHCMQLPKEGSPPNWLCAARCLISLAFLDLLEQSHDSAEGHEGLPAVGLLPCQPLLLQWHLRHAAKWRAISPMSSCDAQIVNYWVHSGSKTDLPALLQEEWNTAVFIDMSCKCDGRVVSIMPSWFFEWGREHYISGNGRQLNGKDKPELYEEHRSRTMRILKLGEYPSKKQAY